MKDAWTKQVKEKEDGVIRWMVEAYYTEIKAYFLAKGGYD